eukprot:jgi/Tetstr1/444533/TSEL_032411.t1
MQDLDIGRKARIQTPDSVILAKKDDTQHEGAVARIKEWLALSKDEADALEDRKLGTFPRTKASGDAGDGEEEEAAEDALVQELCSRAHLGKKIAAEQGDGDATEENEQAKANEDAGNPVGDEDDEEEEEGEQLDGEEEEGTGADNTSGAEDAYMMMRRRSPEAPLGAGRPDVEWISALLHAADSTGICEYWTAHCQHGKKGKLQDKLQKEMGTFSLTPLWVSLPEGWVLVKHVEQSVRA